MLAVRLQLRLLLYAGALQLSSTEDMLLAGPYAAVRSDPILRSTALLPRGAAAGGESRGVHVRLAKLSVDDLAVADSHENVDVTLHALWRCGEALEAHQEALRVRLAKFGACHRYTIASQDAVEKLWRMMAGASHQGQEPEARWRRAIMRAAAATLPCIARGPGAQRCSSSARLV